jgi:divalent metal cation (Fe/Co/Zn/Cd) transporter
VGLARNVTFQKSEQVVSEVRNAIHGLLKEADATVNAVPREVHTENIFDRIRAAAQRNNLLVHDISVQDLGGSLHVEQHVELDERYTLLEAHDHVTTLEEAIREAVPEISSILTHIESEPATIETSDEIVKDRELEHQLKDIVEGFPDVVDVHDIVFKRVRDHLFLSCHVTMQDNLPLSRVHDIQTALEIRFKQVAPKLFRVLIHPEPQTDNRR